MSKNWKKGDLKTLNTIFPCAWFETTTFCLDSEQKTRFWGYFGVAPQQLFKQEI